MQQYQFIGEPLPGYPDEYKIVRTLTKAEVHNRVMALMPTALSRCLIANMDVVRSAYTLKMAA
jgi:hypothetical protein